MLEVRVQVCRSSMRAQYVSGGGLHTSMLLLARRSEGWSGPRCSVEPVAELAAVVKETAGLVLPLMLAVCAAILLVRSCHFHFY